MGRQALLRTVRRRPWPWILAVVFLVVALPSLWPDRSSGVRLTFFDVGQGDAIHIRGREQFDIVIDGGPTERFARQLSQALATGDRTVDLLVLTHPHADHIVGLLDMLTRYDVREVLVTDAVSESRAFTVWQERLAVERAEVVRAQPGQRFVFPGGSLTVLWPDGSKIRSLPLNDSSIVLRLDVEGTCALFMGDVSGTVEQQLDPDSLRCPILKVGHHGSASASSDAFLQRVQPDVAVISVGQPNRFGHPAASTLRRLQQATSHIYRTDLDGTVEMQLNTGGQVPKVKTTKRRPG